MDMEYPPNSFLFIGQTPDQESQIIQYFEMKKVLNNGKNDDLTPIIVKSSTTNPIASEKVQLSPFLKNDLDILDMNELRHTQKSLFPFSIAWFRQIDTTQRFLLEHEGPMSYVVCVADTQTSGRGRSMRHWDSPLGCLMFSIKLPTFDIKPNLLEFAPHLAALAVSVTIRQLTENLDIDIKIRWPYDVIINGHKICGIINETCRGFNEEYVVVGIGLNLNNTNTVCLKDIMQSNSLLSRSFILGLILGLFRQCLFVFIENGFDVLASTYYSMWQHSQQIIDCVGSDQEVLQVRVTGISEDAYLLGELKVGESVELYPDHNCEDSLTNMMARFLSPV